MGVFMKKLTTAILIFAAFLVASNPVIAATQRSMTTPIIAGTTFVPAVHSGLRLSLAPTITQALPNELSDAELSQVQGEFLPLIILGAIVAGTAFSYCFVFCFR
jgi:uncharacterized protein (DUF2062 family)